MKTINKTKIIGLFILVAASYSLNSCFGVPSSLKREFTEQNNAIPPDFGKEPTVLLCMLQERGSYDKYLKGGTKKYYKGEYEFITMKEMNSNPKYSDKKKYRYYFDYTSGTTMTTTYSDGMSASSTAKRFFVKDRLTDKMYQSGGESGLFGKAIKAYMGNLEIKRNAEAK